MAWSRWRSRRTRATPWPYPPALKYALIGSTQVTDDDQAEYARGKMATNSYLSCSYSLHYCLDRDMDRIVSDYRLEQASQQGVWRCGFRACRALERWWAKFR